MRLVYLDEAGVSNPAQEPNLVVAGIIISGDQDWRKLERHILSLRRKYLPDADHPGFIFHAKDIWHGTNYFQRDKWPLERRLQILMDLVEIPRRFHLPVVCCIIDRAAFTESVRPQLIDGHKATATSTTGMAHVAAFMNVVMDVDGWMGANASAEVAMLMAEDVPKVKEFIKGIHARYTDPLLDDADTLTTQNIVDTVNFAAKEDSLILQVADSCCFVIKRAADKKSDIAQFYKKLQPQIISPWVSPGERPRYFQVRVRRSQVELVSDDKLPEQMRDRAPPDARQRQPRGRSR